MAAPKTDEKKAGEADSKPAAPTLAERIESARLHRGTASEIPPGTIVGAREDSVYAVFVIRDYHEAQLKSLRKHMALRGYELASDGEFLVGDADVEIWRAPKEIGDDAWKDEFLACLLNEAWVDLQIRRPNHGIARKCVELAKRVHEPRLTPTDRQKARDELTRHVRLTPIPGLQVHY